MMFPRSVGNLAAGLPRQVSIVGAKGMVCAKNNQSSSSSKHSGTTSMIRQVLNESLEQAQLTMQDIDGLIAVPSLTHNHFMEAHYQATCLGMFSSSSSTTTTLSSTSSSSSSGAAIKNRRPLRCRTIDTGGAGPVTALLEGVRMIKYEALECVAVVAADSVGSMESDTFLAKADGIFLKLQNQQEEEQQTTAAAIDEQDSRIIGSVKSPAIPHGYDRITQYQMENFGLTRDQLRMAVCLESLHAGIHPESLFRRKKTSSKNKSSSGVKNDKTKGINTEAPSQQLPLYTTLDEVRQAPSITPNISLLECARRADGAACLILASNRFLARRNVYQEGLPTIIGGGESSGPLYPPTKMTESHFSCEEAMALAYASAGNLSAQDIDFFGLYDCFPICLVRALEAAGLCPKGEGGQYIEKQYERMMNAIQEQQEWSVSNGEETKKTLIGNTLLKDRHFFPVNTHGGLLCFGAPWEVPAMFNIIEAANQIRGEAKGRQIDNCKRALVYGNGGILSASAVAILARSL